MARKPRNIVADYPFHVIVRGNNRQPVFLEDEDRRAFKAILQAAAFDNGLAVHAYTLMDNHVHLIATPAAADSLALVMQALGRQYVRLFNRRHQRSGTLWEGRYRASIIQEDLYFLTCQRYVEMNPVRAELVARPELFSWSSHRHYLGLIVDGLVSPHNAFWALGNTPFDREIAYRRLFEEAPTISDARLTQAILMGHPIAEPHFLEALEARTGVQWSTRSVGRPRKAN